MPDDARSLDLVQRVIFSALTVIVIGSVSIVLAGYTALHPTLEPYRRVGLWIMSGVIGLVSAAAVLLINRRRPWSPWVLLGLLPMAAAAWWVLG